MKRTIVSLASCQAAAGQEAMLERRLGALLQCLCAGTACLVGLVAFSVSTNDEGRRLGPAEPITVDSSGANIPMVVSHCAGLAGSLPDSAMAHISHAIPKLPAR